MSKLGYIDRNGKYIVRPTRVGYSTSSDLTESSQYKTSEHDRQRQDHLYELIQPYINGEPNDEFIEAYPNEAELYGFTKRDDD